MFKFDMPSSLLVLVVSFFLGFCVLCYIRSKYKETFDGIGYFVLYYLLTSIGAALILFRASLPIFVSVIFANSVLFIANLFLLNGILGFCKIKGKIVISSIALLIFVACFTIFTYISPNVTARIIIYALSGASVHFVVVVIIYKHFKNKDKTLMFPINIFYTIYYLSRIIVIFFTKESFSSFFDYHYDALILLLDGLIGLLTVIGIFDMISNKFFLDMIEVGKSKNRLLDNIPGFAYRCLNDKDWTMQFISSAFEEMTGYRTSEVIGNKKISYNDIISPEYQNEIWEGFSKSTAEGKTYAVEYEIIKKNGKKIWVWEQGKGVYDVNGELIAIEGLVSDITKRKNDEAELIKLTKENKLMEENIRYQQKIESVSVLAGGVAHEINNPINGIMNYGQLIADSSNENSEIKKYAQEIIVETDRVSAIVKNLLNFARKDLNKISNTNTENLVNDTLLLIRNMLKEENIVLEVDLRKNLPNISCNEQQIQQALMSIFLNARYSLNKKYDGTNENKKINITIKKIKDDKFIRITVEDNGDGIPKSIQDKIFDPFFTTKSRAEAMGLGLSICYNIIKAHQGELTFETEEGNYTKFYLDLPIGNSWGLDEN